MIAETDKTQVVEGNHYFPPDSKGLSTNYRFRGAFRFKTLKKFLMTWISAGGS